MGVFEAPKAINKSIKRPIYIISKGARHSALWLTSNKVRKEAGFQLPRRKHIMIINHNIAALNTHRQLSVNT
ncbi:hypothetical protein ACFFSY_14090, partial [Paenibacillus aurantiacus]